MWFRGPSPPEVPFEAMVSLALTSSFTWERLRVSSCCQLGWSLGIYSRE